MPTKRLLIAIAFACILQTFSNGAEVEWLRDYEQARKLSVETGRPILLHFYSNNCPPCKLLDAKAFKTQELIDAFSQRLIPVKINVDDHRELADQYQIARWPTDVYLFPSGEELHRMVSPQDPAVYKQVVERVAIRNRDWVLQRNAAFASKQQQLQQRQETFIPEIVPVKTAQTPTPVAPPGQAPKPVIGQLTGYPTPKEESNPSPAPNRFGNTSTIFEPTPPSTDEPRTSEPVVAPALNPPPQLAPIVPGNRYRASIAAKQDASNKPSDASSTANNSTTSNRYRTQPSPFQRQPSAPESHPNPYVSQFVQQPSQQPSQQPNLLQSSNEDAKEGKPTSIAAISPPEKKEVKIQTVSTSTDRNPAKESPSPKKESVSPVTEEIVFDGYCPIALEKLHEWRQGNPQFGVRHRGRIYHCESEEARTEFLRAPDKFSPVFSGYDIVEFLEKGKIAPGKREWGCWFRGQIYLFASQESHGKFLEAKQTFIQEIENVQNGGRVAEAPDAKVQR